MDRNPATRFCIFLFPDLFFLRQAVVDFREGLAYLLDGTDGQVCLVVQLESRLDVEIPDRGEV